MSMLTNRLVRKYASFYSRVRANEGSDSDGTTMRSVAHAWPSSSSSSSSSPSFTWLHRAFSNGSSHAHVPLSESPKRELRMRSATKAGRHHANHSKKQKKHVSKLFW